MIGIFFGAYPEISHFKSLYDNIIEKLLFNLTVPIGSEGAEFSKVSERKAILQNVKFLFSEFGVGIKVACNYNVFFVFAIFGNRIEIRLSGGFINLCACFGVTRDNINFFIVYLDFNRKRSSSAANSGGIVYINIFLSEELIF